MSCEQRMNIFIGKEMSLKIHFGEQIRRFIFPNAAGANDMEQFLKQRLNLPVDEELKIFWQDEEGDMVTILNSFDWQDVLHTCRANDCLLKLFINCNASSADLASPLQQRHIQQHPVALAAVSARCPTASTMSQMSQPTRTIGSDANTTAVAAVDASTTTACTVKDTVKISVESSVLARQLLAQSFAGTNSSGSACQQAAVHCKQLGQLAAVSAKCPTASTMSRTDSAGSDACVQSVQHSTTLAHGDVQHSSTLAHGDVQHSSTLARSDVQHRSTLTRSDVQHSSTLAHSDVQHASVSTQAKKPMINTQSQAVYSINADAFTVVREQQQQQQQKQQQQDDSSTGNDFELIGCDNAAATGGAGQ